MKAFDEAQRRPRPRLSLGGLFFVAALGFLLPGLASEAQAQLDKLHYIPPFYARSDLRSHYIMVSTLETTPFDVAVTDGAGNAVHTFTGLTRAVPQVHEMAGSVYDQLGLLDQPELNTITTEGLILTGPKPFLVNMRHETPEQGFSLTSKGTFGLGTEFRSGHLISNNDVASTKSHSIAVMATEDDTLVTFDDIDAGIAFLGGACTGSGDAPPFLSSVTLDAGQSYVIGYNFDCPASNLSNDPNDVNGVRVTATKPIVVNSGSWLAGNRPDNKKDIGIDQVVPVDRLGSDFIVIEGKGGANADVLERPGVVAATDSTDIFVGGSTIPLATIDAGEYFYIPASHYSAAGNMFIQTSEPAFLYQSTSGNAQQANGMSFIPPLRCNGVTEVVIPDADLVGTSELGIIARVGASLAITDDGVPVAPGTANAVVGTAEFVTYSVEVKGTVDIVSSDVLSVSLVTSSGFKGAAGFFSGFADSPSISISGGTDLCEGSPITLTATATIGFDSFQWYFNGVPIAGATSSSYDASAPGDYTVTGTVEDDPESDFCNGGTSGESPFITLNTDSCFCGDGGVDPFEECDDGNTVADDGCGPTCLDEFCGDGIDNNGNEECDDGNTVAGDGCDATCQDEFCGDGITNDGGAEQCDDGNVVAGDGCDATCQDEFCGDGVTNDSGTEECDDGNVVAGDGCDATCQDEFCGDGITNDGGTEECDDGNVVAGDGCNATCQDEFCGDGVTNDSGTEECDDGNNVAGDGCNAACEDEFCGDGVTNNNGVEECDDGNIVAGDGCSPTCLNEFCGDGVTSGVEECDDGNNTGGDGCGPTCLLEGCGDGVTTGAEECDDGNTDADDGCGPTCLTEFCGDGIDNNVVEECDDGNIVADDGCGPTCLTEFCGDGTDNNIVEECDDGNNDAGDGCGPTCLTEFCGDALINNVDEECDDGNADPGDGCDSSCVVEPGWECSGEPSTCVESDPNLDQLFEGTWPDIGKRSKFITFVSPEDLHNDTRVLVDNADLNEEVFILYIKPKKRFGLGVCLAGGNVGLPCASHKDCPSGGVTKTKPCGRFLQQTDTLAGGSPFSQTMVAPNGKATAYVDATGGPGIVPVWNRKTFERVSLPAAITDIGEGSAPTIERNGKLVSVESTADLTGENADGNSEIFIYDTTSSTWRQLTDTVAPVENHRPIFVRRRRIVFDSNGDIGDGSRGIDNPDLNRELFNIRIRRGKVKIPQLTYTTGADLTMGCGARKGAWIFFNSDGDLHNVGGASPPSNADANSEIFLWRKSKEIEGRMQQLTDSTLGENVNADCAPRGRLFVFESTSDLDSDGSSNRRVYVQHSRKGTRRLMSPSPVGESVRPRISRWLVVFASTSDLVESNPDGDSVIYLYDTRIGDDGLITR